MVELLAVEKARLLAANGTVTRQDFDEAWAACWEVMVDERGWPHATMHRRAWKRAQKRTRREIRAAFLNEPTPFAFAAARISEAASGMCLHLEAEHLGKALLAAMAYVEVEDEDAAWLAASAANAFVTGRDEQEMAEMRRAARDARIAELQAEGLTIREIAEKLNMPAGTVGSVVARGEDRRELVAA